MLRALLLSLPRWSSLACGWVKGEMPYTTKGNVIGVVIGSKLEGGIMENPRTFLKVITSEKIGWINSQFCVEV